MTELRFAPQQAAENGADRRLAGGENRTPDRRKPPEGGRLSRGEGVGLSDPVGRLRPDRRICQLVLQTNGLALVSLEDVRRRSAVVEL